MEPVSPEYLRIIGEGPTRSLQFNQSTVVIEVSTIKVLRSCQMRFACVRTQARGDSEGGFE